MKRFGLVAVTGCTLLLTSAVLTRAGWFGNRSSPARTDASPNAKTHEEALLRWHQGQPHHWRACLLAR